MRLNARRCGMSAWPLFGGKPRCDLYAADFEGRLLTGRNLAQRFKSRGLLPPGLVMSCGLLRLVKSCGLLGFAPGACPTVPPFGDGLADGLVGVKIGPVSPPPASPPVPGFVLGERPAVPPFGVELPDGLVGAKVAPPPAWAKASPPDRTKIAMVGHKGFIFILALR
jgi:hypothetical protein